MKKLLLAGLLLVSMSYACAQEERIPLGEPSASRGADIMKALRERQSTREFSTKDLSHQDLTDLLWAANGFNRPDKRTAPSAMNKQDIEVYACTAKGAYLYDAKGKQLVLVNKGDFRQDIAGRQASVAQAPVILVLVSNHGESTWTAEDAGIVSQNISLFCAGAGLGTVARGSMNKEALRKDLKLTEKQALLLNHPVGYKK